MINISERDWIEPFQKGVAVLTATPKHKFGLVLASFIASSRIIPCEWRSEKKKTGLAE